jgi:hypothetical protein
LLIKSELNLLNLTTNRLASFIMLAVSFTGVSESCLIKGLNQRFKLKIDFASFLLTMKIVIISTGETGPFFIKDPLTCSIGKI